MNEKEIKEMYKELKRNKKIIGSIDVDFFFEFADAVLNLLEKKDKESHFIQSKLDISNAKIIELNKMIDLMAKYIGKTDDETFCDEDKCERDIEDNVIGCDEDCQECVKQYFEREVKNG